MAENDITKAKFRRKVQDSSILDLIALEKNISADLRTARMSYINVVIHFEHLDVVRAEILWRIAQQNLEYKL